MIVIPFCDWFGCSDIITKAAVYAIDQTEALKKMNFIKSSEPLVGQHQNMIYNDYWIRKNKYFCVVLLSELCVSNVLRFDKWKICWKVVVINNRNLY